MGLHSRFFNRCQNASGHERKQARSESESERVCVCPMCAPAFLRGRKAKKKREDEGKGEPSVRERATDGIGQVPSAAATGEKREKRSEQCVHDSCGTRVCVWRSAFLFMLPFFLLDFFRLDSSAAGSGCYYIQSDSLAAQLTVYMTPAKASPVRSASDTAERGRASESRRGRQRRRECAGDGRREKKIDTTKLH